MEETALTLLADHLANLEQPKEPDKMDQNQVMQELTKKTTKCWLKASSRTACQGRADRPRGA
jgi:hypothetical protein